jgi:hypothetical protein
MSIKSQLKIFTGINRRRLGQLAIALGLSILVSACSSSTPDHKSDLNEYLETQISDAGRSQALQSLSVVLDNQIRDMVSDMADHDRELRIMNITYETTADELWNFLNDAEEKRLQHQDVILMTFLEMRAIATESEWKKLAKLQIEWATSSARSTTPL